MPRTLWWLLACSPTATAVLMTTATRAATTNDWRAVPEILKRREVSAVFVEDAASLRMLEFSSNEIREVGQRIYVFVLLCPCVSV